jgi:hypothetical protein
VSVVLRATEGKWQMKVHQELSDGQSTG